MRTVQLHQMKRPTKRKSSRKVYALRWVGTDGKRYMETLGDVGKMPLRDAEAKRRAKEGEIDNRIIPRDKPKRVTLGEFIERYGESLKAGVTANTVKAYEQSIANAIAALGKNRTLADITTADVDRIIVWMQRNGLAKATIKGRISKLGAMWNKARRYKLVQGNPFAGAAKFRTQSKPMRIFTAEEVNAMLEVCGGQWWRSFLTVAVTTGLRHNELLHLQWQDVDFDNAMLRVARKDAGEFKVGERTYPVLPFAAKVHQQRAVPLAAEAVAELQRQRLKVGGSEYVFLSLERLALIQDRMDAGTWAENTPPMNNVLRDFKLIQQHARKVLADRRGVKVADVPWRVGTVHDLRRTFCTRMASSGIDPYTLGKWAGHEDSKTTMQFYHEVQTETTERARAIMSDLFQTTVQDAQRTRKPFEGKTAPVGTDKNADYDTVSA